MRQKLALAATVGTLALAPPSLASDGALAEPLVVRVERAPTRAGPRLVFPDAPRYVWLRTWTVPRFYAGDLPLVTRGESSG